MSIAKPSLKNVWANSGSVNMADPGGVNETGIPSLAKSIPRRWLNWILNRIETPVRYLVARGIPDYDVNESYSIGDRVQFGGGPGKTYVCVVASVGDGSGTNSPSGTPANWERWGRGIPSYNATFFYEVGDTVFAPSDGASYVCIAANGPSAAKEPHANKGTFWNLWGHLDSDVVDIIHSNENMSVLYSSSGMSLTTGSVSDIVDIRLGYATVIRDLSFVLGSIPSSPGYIDVALSSPIAFASAIKNIQVTSAVAPGSIPAYGEIIANNTVRVHGNRNGGPMATAYVRLLGY